MVLCNFKEQHSTIPSRQPDQHNNQKYIGTIKKQFNLNWLMLKQCGWLSVSQLGVYHSLLLLYKILQSKSPRYLYSKPSNQVNLPYKMRSTANHRIRLGSDSHAGAGLARDSFKYRATRAWNNLPLDIRQSANINIFKIKLKKWIIEIVPIS